MQRKIEMEYESDIITVATVNFKAEFANKRKNVSKICDYMKAAKRQGADLVLFPETCVVGYDYYISDKVTAKEKEAETETLDGPTNTEIANLAKESGIYVVFGTGEKDPVSGEIYNSAIIAGPQGMIGSYRKIHPFDNENLPFKKGSDPFMFDTKWGPISVGICYDTYQFPELQRYYVSKGSRLFLNPTALLEEVGKEGSRQAFYNYYVPLLEYGVLCNTIYIASANLVGYDDKNFFGGGSGILGPIINTFSETGVTWYAGGKDNMQAGISIATIDLSLATRVIFLNNKYAGEPDYRPEIYRNLYNDVQNWWAK